MATGWRTGMMGKWIILYGIGRRGHVLCSDMQSPHRRGKEWVASLPLCPAPATMRLTEGILAHPPRCLSSASSFPPVTTPAEASWKDLPPAPAQGGFAPDPSHAGPTSASSKTTTSVSMGHGLLCHLDRAEEPGQTLGPSCRD